MSVSRHDPGSVSVGDGLGPGLGCGLLLGCGLALGLLTGTRLLLVTVDGDGLTAGDGE